MLVIVLEKVIGLRRPFGELPPLEFIELVADFVRVLEVCGQQEQNVMEEVVGRKTAAKDTEDRVFRMWALQAAEAPEKEVQAAAQELVATQREDGGWLIVLQDMLYRLLGPLFAHTASHEQTVLTTEQAFFNQRTANCRRASHLHMASNPGQLTV